jgi:hypothetical protein
VADLDQFPQYAGQSGSLAAIEKVGEQLGCELGEVEKRHDGVFQQTAKQGPEYE